MVNNLSEEDLKMKAYKFAPLFMAVGLYACEGEKPGDIFTGSSSSYGNTGVGGSAGSSNNYSSGGSGGSSSSTGYAGASSSGSSSNNTSAGGSGSSSSSATGGSGGDGAGGAGGADCIPNNPGKSIDGVTIEHYIVAGETAEEAVDDIFDPENGKGPVGDDGQKYAGNTDCNLGIYSYEMNFNGPTYNAKKECCYTASVKGSPGHYEITMQIPQWSGCDHCWDKMLDALVEHEKGHADLCKAIGEKLISDITAASSTACDHDCNTAGNAAAADLDAKITKLFNDATASYAQQSGDYDIATDHGETQGATYKPDCE